MHKGSRYIIAYSGGVDSHVLLHLMSGIDADLLAVHVNHHLSPNADAWVEHCEQTCKALNVPFKSVSIQVEKKPRQSLEALARDLRYEALGAFVDDGDALLTGHNADDQAETVLLQLMRGSGLKGLSAMPRLKPFYKGKHARPLLNMSRADIQAYAYAEELSWIEDESNYGDRFDRSFLRQQVMPLLVQRREGVVRNMARSASHIAQAGELLDDLAAIDFETIKTSDGWRILIEPLKSLSDARQSNVLRFWLGEKAPSQAILSQIKRQLIYAAPDAHPSVTWKDMTLVRQSGEIINN